MGTGADDARPLRAATRAPDWLDDDALDALLATPTALAALADLHARPELPPRAHELLGEPDEAWVAWQRRPAGVALRPSRLRAMCRRDGELWPSLCVAAARSHGREPLAPPREVEAALADASRNDGDPAGALWLGLLFDLPEPRLTPLLHPPDHVVPSHSVTLPDPPAPRRQRTRLVLAAAIGATGVTLVLRNRRARGSRQR